MHYALYQKVNELPPLSQQEIAADHPKHSIIPNTDSSKWNVAGLPQIGRRWNVAAIGVWVLTEAFHCRNRMRDTVNEEGRADRPSPVPAWVSVSMISSVRESILERAYDGTGGQAGHLFLWQVT